MSDSENKSSKLLGKKREKESEKESSSEDNKSTTILGKMFLSQGKSKNKENNTISKGEISKIKKSFIKDLEHNNSSYINSSNKNSNKKYTSERNNNKDNKEIKRTYKVQIKTINKTAKKINDGFSKRNEELESIKYFVLFFFNQFSQFFIFSVI